MTEERITSRQNPLIRQIRRLLGSRAERYRSGLYAADGVKLLQEAVRWDAGLETVLLSDTVTLPDLPDAVRLVRVPRDLMQWLSPMEAPQGVLFVCRMPDRPAPALQPGCLILDGLQDPGNVGTILRTADALQVPVLLTEDCADPWNPKTVRASMGAVFRTQPMQLSREQIILLCRENGVPLAVTALAEDTQDIRTASLQDCAVVIGSEGSGVHAALLEAAGFRLRIPMSPRCESLNAAAAAAIVLWEMAKSAL